MMKHCTQTVRNILRNHQQITTPILWSLFSYFFTSFFVHSRNYALRNDIKNYLKNSLIKLKHLFIERSLVALTLITVTFSCGGDKSVLRADLNLAIRLSGENRPELEKVLRHYSADKKDSLKLKAAKFLISNMIRHYSFGGEYMKRHIATVDSIYSTESSIVKTLYYMVPIYSGVKSHELEIKPDVLHIKGDFIIDNIEKSFRLWENMGYESTVSFDDFCEYILPYKISNEPLISWKDSMSNHSYVSTNRLDMNSFSEYVDYLYSSHYYANATKLMDKSLASYFPVCKEIVNNEVFAKRSMGIPAVVDYVPSHAIRNGRHFWVTTIDKRLRGETNNTHPTKYAAKVYRRTYSINPIPIDNKNLVPDLMKDPYNKDVTEIYEKVANFDYKFKNRPSGVKFGYLSVFNDLDWREVAWSKFKGNNLTFEKMGRDIVYMPSYYDGRTRVFGQYPVFVDPDGVPYEIIPNKDSTQNVILNRKYSYNIKGDIRGEEALGMHICGSNDLENMKFDSITILTHYLSMQYDTVNTNSTKKYKHWLIRKVGYKHVGLSELDFFNENGEEITGDSFMIMNNRVDHNAALAEIVFDNNLLTAASIYDGVGLSFKEPTSVSYVRHVSHSDENGIYPDNKYELFYFDQGQWVSLGEQTASGYSLEYKDIPTNALFWLRNHTKGKEERPFTISHGKIRFR